MNHPDSIVVEDAQHGRSFCAPSPNISTLWLGKPCIIVAWLGIFLALISPPNGLGIPVCLMYSATGIPCLGCGLTRSLSCALRGMFAESWHYHPMGAAILALFLFTAIQSVLPKVYRARLELFLQANGTTFHLLYLAFVTMFVAYGVGRALLHFIGR
jgi:Protein of unknown function (DUF2752)